MTSAAIAVILKQERDVIAHFRQMRALSPESAKTLAELNVHDGRPVRRLRAMAVLRENATGALYFDALSWDAVRASRRKRVFIMLAIVVVAAAVVMMTTLRNAQ